MAVLATNKKGTAVQKKDKAFTQKEVEEIQKLAYQFFVERGYQHGHHESDWLKAENIVRSKRS